MKSIGIMLSIVSITGFSPILAQNVGIGVPVPQEKLDIAGSLKVDGRVIMVPQVVAAANGITADANRSTIVIQPVAGTQTNAVSLNGSPAAGQALYITNLDNNAASFSGISIPAGETRGFLYRLTPSAGWTLQAAPGTDNLGNHTATAPLNMNGNPIQNSGFIGIGTATPVAALHVTNGNIYAQNNSVVVSNGAVRVENTTDGKLYELHYDASGQSFHIAEGGTMRHLTIQNGGNVGIGTANPGAKLDVQHSSTDFVAKIKNNHLSGGSGLSVESSSDNGFSGQFQNNGNNGKGINIVINDPGNAIMNGGFKDEAWPVGNTWYRTDFGYIFPGGFFDPTPPLYYTSLLPTPERTALQGRILSAEYAGNFWFKDNEPDENASRYYFGVDRDNEFLRFTSTDPSDTITAGMICGYSYTDYATAYAYDPCEAVELLTAFCDLDPLAIACALAAPVCKADKDVIYGVSYLSGGGDYAEYLERVNLDEQMFPGEIVGVRAGKITRNLEGAERLMVISSRPIVLGNMPQEGREDRYEKVAFLGQAEIRVRGAVHTGDYILPGGQNDGFGIPVAPEKMTPADFARVVGRAWATDLLNGPKLVNCIVGLQNNDWAHMIQDLRSEVQTLKKEQETTTAELKSELQLLRNEIRKMSTYSAE